MTVIGITPTLIVPTRLSPVNKFYYQFKYREKMYLPPPKKKLVILNIIDVLISAHPVYVHSTDEHG